MSFLYVFKAARRAARAAATAAWPSLSLALRSGWPPNSRSAGAKIADYSVGAQNRQKVTGAPAGTR
jgi:hypothetical protein